LKSNYQWQEAIPITLEENHPKLLAITGENASGKSMLRRLLQQIARKKDIESISISPEWRQQGGILRAFVYGDESYDASGKIAANVVLKAIKTSNGRTNSHIIILDEIDMGLSDNAAAGVGEEIADFCKNAPQFLNLFVVISHRKPLLEPIMDASHIRVGDNMSLKEFIRQPIVPIRPQELVDKCHKMFAKIANVLNQ
jgi:ABC-type dipeptide/oligopeptide/nickel transport system ATPase component